MKRIVVKSAVPLHESERIFSRLHRHFMDRGYPTPPWDRLDPRGLTDDEVEATRRAWAARTVAEYRSLVVFGEIISRLPELGLPLEVMSAASRLLVDESRHTELCAKLADRLGGHAGATLSPNELRLPRDGLSPLLFVARWTASMFCVGESASVGVLEVLKKNSTDPCSSVVIRTLLRDEMLHDRFGWSLARLVLPRLSEEEADWLAADLAHAFAHYDRIHAHGGRATASPAEPEPAPRTPRPNLGMARRRDTAEAFHARIEQKILPSLAALGVPAYEAWELRKEVLAAT